MPSVRLPDEAQTRVSLPPGIVLSGSYVIYDEREQKEQ